MYSGDKVYRVESFRIANFCSRVLKLILVKARYLAKKEVHNIVSHSNSHNMGRISFLRSLLSIFKRFVFGTIHFRTAIDKLICHLDIKRIDIAKQIPAELLEASLSSSAFS